MEKYFCMECMFFGYDVLGRGVCCKDETNPCMVSPYQVHTETECFRMKEEKL